ncbi:unnamed protein product [Tetraodon nigroviridis]|uniref:(spotted green pufferfish) hypothetical protein n=1 Tax=Tetraodon nigroviridis TaxID=99883 RepID=Q4RKV9_TETNG|nr:unnamed protein product [Tetraodon nigroviridis]
MSRSFYVDSLIIKDVGRPLQAEHPGKDFLIPISMHSPSVMTVTAPVCPSRKNGTFCVCPLCVTSHIHSSRSGISHAKEPVSRSGGAVLSEDSPSAVSRSGAPGTHTCLHAHLQRHRPQKIPLSFYWHLREQPHTERKTDAHGFHEHTAPGT